MANAGAIAFSGFGRFLFPTTKPHGCLGGVTDVSDTGIFERMSDTPSRLELLHFARRVVLQQATASLAQIDGWIADEERREAERRRAEETRPPAPEWLIERGLDRNTLLAVHTGDCWDPGKRCAPITREQAVDALRNQVAACSKCRPDTALKMLE